MKRQPKKKNQDRTEADHQPMLPEFRRPADPLDAAIRGGRHNDCLIDPKRYLNWR